jgi:hypothetical protein
MAKGTTETLLDAVQPEALAPAPQTAIAITDNVTPMFERLARDPSVDVAKLERLLDMHERLIRQQAKAEFDRAFAEMQGDIPTIDEKGRILVDGVLRSRFAKNEDIQEVIKPILKAHGFALRFSSEVSEGRIKVTGTLSHRSGHSERDEFVTLPDKTGSKNDIQAIGSARSYGQRYTTIALLNIATRGEDNDAETAEGRKKTSKEEPPKYQQWLEGLEAVAVEGMPAFAKTWNDSPDVNRKYLVATEPKKLAALRTKADSVTNGGRR